MLITIEKGAATLGMDAAIVADGVRQMIADIKVQELLGGLADCRSLTVDLSATEKTDATGLLFLIALCKTFGGNGRTVRFVGCSPRVHKVCAAVGLEDPLKADKQGGDGHE